MPPESPELLASASARVVDNGKGHYSKALAEVAEEFRWPRVAQPLLRLVDSLDELPPASAPDLGSRVLLTRHTAAQRAHRIWRRLSRS